MLFAIIFGVVVTIIIITKISKSKKEEEVISEEVKPKEGQPVIIELFPKGTKSNPFLCKINSEIALEVRGYLDYKKEKEVPLCESCVTWYKSCPCGRFEKDFGTKVIYYTPSEKGERDLWCKYNDGKLITSASLKILAEE